MHRSESTDQASKAQTAETQTFQQRADPQTRIDALSEFDDRHRNRVSNNLSPVGTVEHRMGGPRTCGLPLHWKNRYRFSTEGQKSTDAQRIHAPRDVKCLEYRVASACSQKRGPTAIG